MLCKVYDRIKTEEKALALSDCPTWVEQKRSEYGGLMLVKKLSSIEFHHPKEGKVLDIAPMYLPEAGPQHNAMCQKMVAEIHNTLRWKEAIMKIRYVTYTFPKIKIRKVAIVSETKELVFFGGSAEPRIDGDTAYFKTFDRAKQFLLRHFADEIRHYRRCHEYAKSQLKTVNDLKDPEAKVG